MPLGQLLVDQAPEIGDAQLAFQTGGLSVRPVAVQREYAARLIQLSITHPPNVQPLAEGALHRVHDGLGILEVPNAIVEIQQETLTSPQLCQDVQRGSGLADVEGHADIAEEGLVGIQARVDGDPHPAPPAICMLEPRLESIGQSGGSCRLHGRLNRRLVVRMDHLFPYVTEDAFSGSAVEFSEGRVDEFDLGPGVRHPDGRRCGIGHQPESRVALAQGDLRVIQVAEVGPQRGPHQGQEGSDNDIGDSTDDIRRRVERHQSGDSRRREPAAGEAKQGCSKSGPTSGPETGNDHGWDEDDIAGQAAENRSQGQPQADARARAHQYDQRLSPGAQGLRQGDSLEDGVCAHPALPRYACGPKGCNVLSSFTFLQPVPSHKLPACAPEIDLVERDRVPT